MKDRLLELLKNNDKLLKNFSYLSVLQVINLLLPLLVYPYLIKILGKETFGLVVYAQAIIGYLVILVGFGFNISATKEISIHRDDKEKLSEIVSSVLVLKTLLFIVAVLVLVLVLNFIPEASGYKVLFYLTLWLCFYDVIFPIWYFQGIEEMKYITYINAISRLLFFGLIFVFIKAKTDYLYVPILNGIGAFIAGIIGLYIVFVKHKIRLILPTYKALKYYFLDSYPIFISQLSIKFYVSSNKVIIGAFLGMTEVAYYDLAEKVINFLKTPQTILSQALFPKISRERNISFIKKAFKLSLALNTLICIGVLVFSKYLVLMLGGESMMASNTLIKLLSVTIPIIATSNVFGLYMLIPFGYNKIFSRIILCSGLFYALQILFIWAFNCISLINVSYITIATEIFVAVLTYWFSVKKNLWKKNTTI